MPNHSSLSRCVPLSLNQPHVTVLSLPIARMSWAVPHGSAWEVTAGAHLPSHPAPCGHRGAMARYYLLRLSIPLRLALYLYIPDLPGLGPVPALPSFLVSQHPSFHSSKSTGYPSHFKWDATLLSTRLPLLLPHSSARPEHQHPRLASPRLIRAT